MHADEDGVLLIPAEYHSRIIDACVLSRDLETRVHIFWRRSDKTPAQKRDHLAKLAAESRQQLRKLAMDAE